jgi:predicted tellurium resistance membrane protein TerC
VLEPILALAGDAATFGPNFIPSMLAAAPAAGGHGPAGEGITNLLSLQALVALVTLTVLEIVLGIDNIIFISVLADKLPLAQQNRARRMGLMLAMVMRVGLLFSISWIMRLTAPIPGVGSLAAPFMGDDKALNWRDFILLLGGLFLIYKATKEIHEKLEGDEHGPESRAGVTFAGVITQIVILDIVFSLDSVITAVGMVQTAPQHQAKGLTVMIAAVVIAVGVMLFAAKPIADFVNRHPTIKMLAFSFLILVGVVLVIDGTHRHVPKGYIYFAMAFSVAVEMLNLRLRRKGKAVELHQPHLPAASQTSSAAAP